MDEQFQGCFVKAVRLGEVQRLTYKAGQAMAQGVVPTLDVGGFSRFFANGAVRCCIKDQLDTLPRSRCVCNKCDSLGGCVVAKPDNCQRCGRR